MSSLAYKAITESFLKLLDEQPLSKSSANSDILERYLMEIGYLDEAADSTLFIIRTEGI